MRRNYGRWPVWETHGYQPDGSFVFDGEIQVRTSDGRRLGEMTEQELRAFEEDPEFDSQIGERMVRTIWYPDGRQEVFEPPVG